LDTTDLIHLSTVLLFSLVNSTGPILLVLLLLACSALISSSEVALFSLTPSQREQIRNAEDSSSRRIVDLLESPDKETAPKRLIATMLIANNTVNIAVVLLTETLLPHSANPTWFEILLNVVLITFVIVLFGEVAPKVYATGHNLRVARFMSMPLIFIRRIFTPLTWFLMQTSTLLENRLRNFTASNISVDELGHALELTQDDNRSVEEHRILEGIVTFGSKEVNQIMKPRTDIAAVWHSDTFEEVMQVVMEKGYSRLPVYADSPDHISGFLFVKDLLPHLDEKELDWHPLIRQPFFVPENKMIDDLLQEFQQSKIHLAIVVDEYGGTSGLVTLEDILEEIVGEISDEFDDEEKQYSKLDDRNYVFEAKMSLVDVYKILDIDGDIFDEARGDSSTLGGFVIEQAGRIPTKGEEIYFEGFIFRIESSDKRKINRIKITFPDAP
jgi:gliding motility-associated protein GldE